MRAKAVRMIARAPLCAVLLALAPHAPAADPAGAAADTGQGEAAGAGQVQEQAAPEGAQAEQAADTPEAVVERLEDTLLENMRAGAERSFEQRMQRLLPLLEDVLHVERMGRYLFGGAWGELEPAQREAFVGAFRRLSAATYAARFNAYNGEEFMADDVNVSGDSRALVRRTLVTGKGKRIAFDYLLTRDQGDWRIVNIITDGVSDLALKRSQYKSLFESGGIQAVIDHVDEAARKQRDE